MTWQRIARTRALLERPAADVIEPLKMSIYSGRVEPVLLLGRLELGYRYLDSLDAEGRGLLLDQTLLAWTAQPREVRKAIASGRLALADIRALLQPREPAILAEMEAGP